LIRYDLQVQDALRSVVRKVLAETARDGLPGEHHFYITFRTQAAGVRLSQRLREQYPEEMTIILQYQFWDLRVEDAGFEVGLHFKNVPERLYVPYEAISGFYDPSVQFGLKFEAQTEDGDEIDGEDDDETIELGPVANPPRPNAPRQITGESEKPHVLGSDPKLASISERPAKSVEKGDKPRAKPKEKQKPAEKSEGAGEDGSKVVSIDAFRKKP
jgi:hypothetical protein